VEVSKIMAHEVGEPNALVDIFDAELPSSEHDRTSILSMQAEAAAGGDDDAGRS
jgi:hypothetical protein